MNSFGVFESLGPLSVPLGVGGARQHTRNNSVNFPWRCVLWKAMFSLKRGQGWTKAGYRIWQRCCVSYFMWTYFPEAFLPGSIRLAPPLFGAEGCQVTQKKEQGWIFSLLVAGRLLRGPRGTSVLTPRQRWMSSLLSRMESYLSLSLFSGIIYWRVSISGIGSEW